MTRSRAWIASLSASVVALFACIACGEHAVTDTSATGAKVIYGEDDRKDVYEVDGPLRDLAMRSIVAILQPSSLDESDSSNVRIVSDPVGRALGLCRSERFWDDPFAAVCSGTLIADDLVLTAGHCFGKSLAGRPTGPAAQACKDRRFVFGYYKESPDEMHRLTSHDVFTCAELVAFRNQGAMVDFSRVDLDFAIVRLDRPATPRFAPARLRADRSMSMGSPLTVLGFPSGTPLKIAANGQVMAVRAEGDSYSATVDTFSGNSGSGIFDSRSLEQVGVLLGGEPDYVRKGSCSVVSRCSETGCDGTRSERIHQLGLALDTYCAQKDMRADLCSSRRRVSSDAH